ncbi:hypothetical protein PEX2_065830 [Penicillium expansum]|uniref:Uncharacterized protein n=1 Tax=Penicillium expansum TaxID=27334 RepID=A0A0A2JT72_PENEN|nr:hypothetical protein PEX2_065830 [Penicillium expansum]KGO58599.1 hypothetical protein PEX2_065830 [Penicillium expansum]
MDYLEVPKLTLDELQGPKLHHGLGELPISKLPVDEHQELKQHRNLDITKISKVTLEEGQEARQHDNFEEHRIQKVPPNEDEYDHPFRDSPITAALKVLAGGNISIVEYGTQVQFRCVYEEVPVVVEWAVPDEQLSLASQILVEHDFPLLSTGTRRWLGHWDTGCLRHGLDRAGWMRVHLLPLSLVGLTLEDTTKVPSMFASEINIFTPKPPRYMISLIHHLQKFQIGDSPG